VLGGPWTSRFSFIFPTRTPSNHSIRNTVQVIVDGTQSSSSCIHTDWQNQWHWETDDAESASAVAARSFACMVNFTSGRLLVFGGLIDAAVSNDTWVFDPLSGAGWRLIDVHPSPIARWSAACYSDGSMAYMHGGAADVASSLSDLWSFNISSFKWSQLLSSSCNSDPSTCSFAARGHVLTKFMSFLYAWDTLAGRLQRFNLASSQWESQTAPSTKGFRHISIAQISSQVYLSLGLSTDENSNLLFLIFFSPSGDPIKFVSVNASKIPLVVGGCMLAFSSQILVLGGKSASAATTNRYR
jgi:hypothetical protein